MNAIFIYFNDEESDRLALYKAKQDFCFSYLAAFPSEFFFDEQMMNLMIVNFCTNILKAIQDSKEETGEQIVFRFLKNIGFGYKMYENELINEIILNNHLKYEELLELHNKYEPMFKDYIKSILPEELHFLLYHQFYKYIILTDTTEDNIFQAVYDYVHFDKIELSDYFSFFEGENVDYYYKM